MRFAMLLLILAAGVALAHGPETSAPSFGELIVSWSTNIVLAGIAVLASVTVLAVLRMQKNERAKRALFFTMIMPTLAVTGFLVASTIYLNLTSWSGGPVHWHADFEVMVCGEPVDIVDPSGLSNLVGSATVHEHGDNRIHIEGVLERREQASVGWFFEKIGGHFEEGHLIVPTMHGVVEKRDGNLCPNGRAGKLKLFVNGEANGQLGDYVIAPFSNVPPGDLLKIVFDEE
ncbi:hypothetical protein HY546_01315 [archaeon]|nr:hypothetical protein [archaeon]